MPADDLPLGDVETQWSELCQFANIDPDDFSEELKQWQFADMTNGMEATGPEREGDAYEANLTIRPKPAEKGFARAAYGAARIRCGIVPSRAKLKSEADYKTFLKQTSVEAVATAAAEAQADKAAALKEKVKLSEVVDVTLAAEIPLIPDDEYDVLWQRFRVVMSRVPEEEEAPSQQQLTALRHLLLVASAYVDFATWCAYHFRTLKAFKCAGMIPGPPDANGAQTFMQQEFKGPPEYSFWWKAWRVFQAAMIMAEACMPTFLKRYAKMIRTYNARYSDALGFNHLWAFLYQCDDRYRREHMPRMLRAAHMKLERIISRSADGRGKLYLELTDGSGEEVEFVPEKPFDYLYALEEREPPRRHADPGTRRGRTGHGFRTHR
jgi:hypothetical protein